MIPISDANARTATKGAGVKRSLDEILGNPSPDKWKLHKFSRGFFRQEAWVACVQLLNGQHQYTLGFIGNTNLPQFARDLQQMIEIGCPTFESMSDILEAIP
jgi:hypothetical protein